MKKISIILCALVALVAFNACETEDDVIFTAQEADGLAFTNTTSSEYVLTNATAGNLAERFTWNAADFGTETNVSYDLEKSNTSDFTEVISVGTTTSTELGVTVGQLLGYASEIGLDNDPATDAPNTGTIYMRLRGYVGAGGLETFSDAVGLVLVLPETTEDEEAALPRLAVPGPHQDWNPDENSGVPFVPYLQSEDIGNTNYEGFVYLIDMFKLVEPNADGAFMWGNPDYGDASGIDGNYTQILALEDEGNCGVPDGEGYYLLNANTTDLTYSATKTDWGIIGNGLTGDGSGWNASVPMSFDTTTRIWTITTNLVAGVDPDDAENVLRIKFRANDAWDINMGEGDDNNLVFGGGDIAVPESGTYLITIDLSNPRAYTYSLELQ
ncbi:SusE domain-containing protein [Cochleicola gelatinilyticus]|uniref:SusE outer membrane protein domain-containing protein n=1 Tax=Cochleicola gelatinilyticus TaxID=1763537 RepID=A0A167HKD1_9FLAO|nr:SusE domain-containing protein [Cochleicola gelatinilyticus]OAB78701.1 hypothetical protein ULVI_08960 [Cochleicola gelatinilyticus]